MRTKTWQPEDILRRALKRAGVVRGYTHVYVRFHDLRHTYASVLIAQGESLGYVKDKSAAHSSQNFAFGRSTARHSRSPPAVKPLMMKPRFGGPCNVICHLATSSVTSAPFLTV